MQQKLQLVFLLRHPERFAWPQDDPGFNRRVHPRLLAAHQRIFDSTPGPGPGPRAHDHRPQAEAMLLRLHSSSLSQRQAMLRYYLLAQCARARDLSLSTHFAQALEWCGRAEQIAGALVDLGAQVDLHELRGTLHRAISFYWIAAEEFSLALRLLREHAEDEESFDPDFEATLTGKAATMDYLLGNFSRALEHVQRAQTLLLLVPVTAKSLTGQGNVAWTIALLQRQRNDPVEALRQVETAAALYRQVGATNSTCRVLYLAAEIALDAVESSAGAAPTAHYGYLTLAARYAEEALEVGRAAEDLSGIELAKLSLARLQGHHGGGKAADVGVGVGATEGVSAITTPRGKRGHVRGQTPEASFRSVLRQARKMRDESLATAAQTELGVDLLARGAVVEGKRWLRKAIATAEHLNAPGLAFRAQRVLRQAEGRNA